MTYIPKRDYRFEYIHEAMQHVEETQCTDCKFREPEDEYPMCLPISGIFMMEQPVKEIDDRGDEGLFCTKREIVE